MKMLQLVADRKLKSVVVSLDDVQNCVGVDGHDMLALVANIEGNTARYMEIFKKAIDELLPQPSDDVALEAQFDAHLADAVASSGAEPRPKRRRHHYSYGSDDSAEDYAPLYAGFH